MRYRLNDCIDFEFENCILSHINHKDKTIKLSVFSTRILMCLIQEDHNVCPRKLLFKLVWEDYGLASSDSNLNQHISILRKALYSLDNSEYIKTIPRTGFAIPQSIRIQKLPEEIVSADNAVEESPSLLHHKDELNYVDEIIVSSGRTVINIRYLWMAFIVIAPTILYSVLMFAMGYGALTPHFSVPVRPELKKVTDGVVHGCEVFSIGTENVSDSELRNILVHNNIACYNHEKIFYSAISIPGEALQIHNRGEVFISKCEENFSYCDSGWFGYENVTK